MGLKGLACTGAQQSSHTAEAPGMPQVLHSSYMIYLKAKSKTGLNGQQAYLHDGTGCTHPHHRLSMMGPTLLGTRAHKHTVTPVDLCDEGDEDRKRV